MVVHTSSLPHILGPITLTTWCSALLFHLGHNAIAHCRAISVHGATIAATSQVELTATQRQHTSFVLQHREEKKGKSTATRRRRNGWTDGHVGHFNLIAPPSPATIISSPPSLPTHPSIPVTCFPPTHYYLPNRQWTSDSPLDGVNILTAWRG